MLFRSESDAASDVEKAGEVDDEGEEVDEDGEKEAKQPTKENHTLGRITEKAVGGIFYRGTTYPI